MNNLRIEQRKVRPFLNVEAFEGLLNGIKVAMNGKYLRGEKEYLDPAAFADVVLDIDFVLNPADIAIAAKEIQLSHDKMSFSLIAYGNTLKQSAVIRSWKLSEANNENTLTLHASDLPAILPDKFGGFNLVFAITLSKNLEPKPLKVYQSGTWLVKREYQIRPYKDISFFSPMPMDLMKKRDLGLPAKSLLYLEYGDEEIQFASAVEDVIKVWVDEDVLTNLQNNKGPAADVAAMMLARAAVGSLVEQISQLFQSKEFDLDSYGNALRADAADDRVLTKFVRRAHKVLGSDDWQQTLQAIKENSQKVASQIEAQVDLRDAIKKALNKDY